MILAINGKINSGKDTIGKIIQELVLGHSDEEIQESILRNRATKEQLEDSGWQIKKFADKLKDIVCLLINCTKQELENQEFKNKELGEEWWYQEYIHKFSGLYSKIPYNSEVPEDVYNDNSKGALVKLTPRLILQLLGTEYGRNIIHPNIWVNSLMSEYQPLEKPEFTVDNVKVYNINKCTFPNWIITDMRFPNELQAVKNKGGITIRVNRPLKYFYNRETQMHELFDIEDRSGNTYVFNPDFFKTEEDCRNDLNKNLHESETALDNVTFDYEIINDGTIEELIEKVKTILKNENII